MCMDDLVDDLTRVARRCERAARKFREGRVAELRERIQEQIKAAHRAWSGSWVGYHARIYIDDFSPARPDERFDSEWGFTQAIGNTTHGRWAIMDEQGVQQELLKRANVSDTDLNFLRDTAARGETILASARSEMLPSLDAALALNEDSVLRRIRDNAQKASPVLERDIMRANMPEQVASRDSPAVSEGIRVPPHLQLEARVLAQVSVGMQLDELAGHARYLTTYIQKRWKMAGKSVAKTDGKIFIGHGRSAVWRELKDFVQDRLNLTADEFNGQPTAGLSTKERLETMLDDAVLALLVMTAEDERADGTKVARANVIHEAGLFQGRLGFERAIILLEEGCEEFSNIVGITQIRFSHGRISETYEDIRRVLEREKILKT